jgi:hypothetical protein
MWNHHQRRHYENSGGISQLVYFSPDLVLFNVPDTHKGAGDRADVFLILGVYPGDGIYEHCDKVIGKGGKMKTKKVPDTRPDYGVQVYKKVGGRYKPMGHEWRGFPMDGVWLVQDGKSCMTCMVGAKERVPIFALNYRIHEQELCRRIQEAIKKPMTLMDEARLCCDFFAEIAEKQTTSAPKDLSRGF